MALFLAFLPDPAACSRLKDAVQMERASGAEHDVRFAEIGRGCTRLPLNPPPSSLFSIRTP